MWLHEIPPTIEALRNYLTRESGGIRIVERDSYYSEVHKGQVYTMSDGFSYIVRDNKWQLLDAD